MNAIARPKGFALTSSQVELLKWIGFASMLVDHANTVLLDRELGMLAAIVGRLAFPLFAIVFGYNLARPGGDPLRIATRLFWAGCLSTLVYVPTLGVWPLNVLFTLSAAAVAVHLLQEGRDAWAWSFVVVAGCVVDYFQPGLLLVLGAWMYARGFKIVGLIVGGAGFGGIAALVNYGDWALLTLPVVYAVSRVDVAVPRWRWAFLAAYPLHLAVLWVASRV